MKGNDSVGSCPVVFPLWDSALLAFVICAKPPLVVLKAAEEGAIGDWEMNGVFLVVDEAVDREN